MATEARRGLGIGPGFAGRGRAGGRLGQLRDFFQRRLWRRKQDGDWDWLGRCDGWDIRASPYGVSLARGR